MNLLDIGGGFPGNNDRKFAAVSTNIMDIFIIYCYLKYIVLKDC